jgi:hypothetical protein
MVSAKPAKKEQQHRQCVVPPTRSTFTMFLPRDKCSHASTTVNRAASVHSCRSFLLNDEEINVLKELPTPKKINQPQQQQHRKV